MVEYLPDTQEALRSISHPQGKEKREREKFKKKKSLKAKKCLKNRPKTGRTHQRRDIQMQISTQKMFHIILSGEMQMKTMKYHCMSLRMAGLSSEPQ